MRRLVGQFRGIARPLLKWTLVGLGFAVLIGVAVAVVFAPLLGSWVGHWFTYDRHFERIQITASPDRKQCPDRARPILVEVTNGSSRPVVEWSFYLDAQRPGLGVDASNGGQWSGSVVPPATTLKMCAAAVLIDDAAGQEPQAFVWRAGLSWVRFSD